MTNMKHFRSIAFAAFAGCIGFALLPSLQADEWNKKTTLTVNEPLQVPSCCTPGHTVTLAARRICHGAGGLPLGPAHRPHLR